MVYMNETLMSLTEADTRTYVAITNYRLCQWYLNHRLLDCSANKNYVFSSEI